MSSASTSGEIDERNSDSIVNLFKQPCFLLTRPCFRCRQHGNRIPSANKSDYTPPSGHIRARIPRAEYLQIISLHFITCVHVDSGHDRIIL